MRTNFIQSIAATITKLLLLAALVVLGIVFVPDGLMEQVERGIGVAGSYLSGEAEKRVPAVQQDIARQTQETKSEAITLYESFKEKYFPAIGSWVAGIFGFKANK